MTVETGLGWDQGGRDGLAVRGPPPLDPSTVLRMSGPPPGMDSGSGAGMTGGGGGVQVLGMVGTSTVDWGTGVWDDGERDISWEAIEIRWLKASALDSSRSLGMTWLKVRAMANSEGS